MYLHNMFWQFVCSFLGIKLVGVVKLCYIVLKWMKVRSGLDIKAEDGRQSKQSLRSESCGIPPSHYIFWSIQLYGWSVASVWQSSSVASVWRLSNCEAHIFLVNNMWRISNRIQQFYGHKSLHKYYEASTRQFYLGVACSNLKLETSLVLKTHKQPAHSRISSLLHIEDNLSSIIPL